jgi:hypothetical protein
MSILNVFKRLKKPIQTEEFIPFSFSQDVMYKAVLEGQAQTIKDIICNQSELNGITSKKLLDYWLNYKFTCCSTNNFKITIDGVEYDTYEFTPESLAEFTLNVLKAPDCNILSIAEVLSAALDSTCVKYSELTALCLYLQENNLRVRKA